MKRISRLILLKAAAGIMLMSVNAFPPAPHHRLYGMVRDELGHPLERQEAIVYLEADDAVLAYGRIVNGLVEGRNYQLSIPMDAGLSGDRYSPTALRPWAAFRLRVQIGETSYLPIEMRGDALTLGEPGKQTRLDLTLGEDSDGDGLPDAWERAYAGGIEQDGSGDADGDGLSNLEEYVAGAYAVDPKDGFALKIVRVQDGRPLLEFTSLPGRVYSIHGSANMKDWEPIEFGFPSQGWSMRRYEGQEVRKLVVEVDPDDGSMRFFKLLVE
jgi:hypothetical protein